MSREPLDYVTPISRTPRKHALLSSLVGAACGAMITFPAVFLAIVSGGSGHGDYILARILFPFTFLLTFETMSNSLFRTLRVWLYGSGINQGFSWPLIAIGLFQFPAYGALFGYFVESRKKMLVASLTIILVHAICVIGCFVGHN